jgi:xyloglucan-specific exo-beta-1,4-glucanase
MFFYYNMKISKIRKSGSIITFLLLLAQTLFAQVSEPYDWGNLPIGGGGFVSAIITSKTEPGLMYCRTDVGGAYRWDAANSKWIPLLDWCSEQEVSYQGVEAIALDPQISSRVYMLVGTSYFNSGKTAILRSDDYGNTFTETIVTTKFQAHGNGMGRQTGEKLAVDPKNSNIVYCGTRLNGLWKSTDAGTTWTQIWNGAPGTDLLNDNGVSFVALDSSSVSGGITQRIFFGVSRKGTNTNFYVSNNAGASFSAVTGGASSVTSIQPHRAIIASDTTIYITYASDDGPWNATAAGAIWKYDITGGTWTNITPAGYTGMSFGGISVDPTTPNRVIASSVNQYWGQYNGPSTAYGDRFFLSTDGGSSWTDLIIKGGGMTLDPNGVSWINENAMHWTGSIEFDPFNTAKAWVTSGNGVFSCDNVDAASTIWKFNVKGLEETVALDMQSIASGPVISAIGDYDGFRHTDVTQYAPIHNPKMGTTEAIDYAPLNPKIVVRAGAKMYYSLDTAKTWTQCTMNGSGGHVALSADGSVFLHCPSNSSTIYRSVNRGLSWTVVSGVSIAGAKPTADPINKNKFYAYNNSSGRIMISTNAGASFASSGTVGTNGSQIIRCTPNMEGHLWVALYNGGLKRSVNSGVTFSAVSGVSNCSAVGLGKTKPGASYPTVYIWGTVSGAIGLFRSTDEGATWIRVNDDDHEYGGIGNGQFVVGDLNEYGRVYMSTVGRGIIMGRKIGASANLLPVVSITSPVSGTTYLTGDDITFSASASDPDGTITSVEFYDGSTLLGSVNSAPYDFTWTNLPPGTHQITARATDDFGVTSVSQIITIYDPVTPDCNGQAGGTAFYDNCGTCVGGTTGLQECTSDCNGVWGGTAYFDACDICVAGNTGFIACVGIEAETACTIDGTTDTFNSGYNGSGYVNPANSLNSAVAWALNSSGNQTVAITMKFSNRSSSSRTASLYVNGTLQISSIDFYSTGSWTNWQKKVFNVNLSNGINYIKLVSLTSNGGPMYDRLTWDNSSVTAGSCTDCTGQPLGTAFYDNCGTCVAGTTGFQACISDCNGEWGGTAYYDDCNICVGGNTGLTECLATNVLNSLGNSADVQFSPNPFYDKLNLQFDSPFKYNIMDISGKIISGSDCISGSCNIGEQLKPGIYFLQIHYTTGREQRLKVIKM